MAAGNTYVSIATQTLGSATASVTFNSIPSTYTDLVLVVNSGFSSSSRDLRVQINNDTNTNYSGTFLYGNGTSAGSTRDTSNTYGFFDVTGTDITLNATWIVSFNNYSNTTTYKTYLSRFSNAGRGTDATVGLWSNTAAITSLVISGSSGNVLSGSTFNLYGIAYA
jgi:hypothetical protein